MEYLNGKMWNGKICDDKGNIIFEIKNGKSIFMETERCKDYSYLTKYYIEYVGEYLKGKRNGKGKEFMIINGENFMAIPTIFEGEYLNGERKKEIEKKRNGKGKIFNYNGELIFEGEYVNGKRKEI